MTPVPMAFWAPEPAPLAMASGKTPNMKASEVIRIGRSRCARRLQRRPRSSSMPCSTFALANSTMRMAFLADRPMVVSRPTWK